jgi:CheY-like chemotaxis protein
MHGGSISVASEGLGKGATFTVRLPLSAVATSELQTATPTLSADDQERLRILVVDDNRDTATSCAMLLKNLGHETSTAYDGLAALETARTFHPQVLFLDIGLPGMNGYDVVRTLRSEGFQNETIVAISGYGQPDDRRRSQEAGFDNHLVKPIDQSAILSVLRSAREKQSV